MAKALTDEQRQLRINLVEALVDYCKSVPSPTPEVEAELTKQVQRIAKFLSVSN